MATVPLAPTVPSQPPTDRVPAKRRRQIVADEFLGRAWGKGWLPRPDLDPERLIAAACGPGRQGDLEEGGWRQRLDVLTQALEAEAFLNRLGRTIAYGQLVMALRNRLLGQDLWRRHPEIADYPIRSPILVIGQMRSGTTRMQRLLACDPRFAFTRFFESWAPFPGRASWDDRPLRAWVGLRCAHLINPEFRYIHPTGLREADEEIGLQNMSIFGAAFEAQWRVPSFAAHIEAVDARPIYAEFKRQLQTIGWLRRGERPRPWVLKLPQFAQDAEALLATFPDARIVVVERDRADVVASSASLVRNQMLVQSDHVDGDWIGREWVRKTQLRQARLTAALSGSAAPRATVRFEAFAADWAGEMVRAYAALGLPLTSEVRHRMEAFLTAPEHRALAKHRYSPGDFGLSGPQSAGLPEGSSSARDA